MKVVDLWNKFYSWSPYTDVLKRYANNEVVEFDYDSEKDKLSLVV